jgi:NAD(P)-dependent dehydrogenase (short-subunit alcohol dehydrogenase family)
MTPDSQHHREHLLVFGASGAIGTAICNSALARGWRVTGVARDMSNVALDALTGVSLDPFEAEFPGQSLRANAPFTAVCWAQGANRSDSVYDVQIEAHLELYRANVLYVLLTMKALLEHKLLEQPARFCVISSIWQNLARQSKLSYCITKAALQGLVLSASADLAAEGHLINAVLPGALDTPMTRRNLTDEQVQRLTGGTGFGRLPALEDVTSLVCYLCSAANTGVTGQFIAADLGFSHVRIV